MPYNRAYVKTANERLRKLEDVYHKTTESNAYQYLSDQATDHPNTTGRFINMSEDLEHIRFINKTDYDKLSAEEQAQFDKMVNDFLDAPTSTKSGIESKYNKAFSEFNKDNEYQFKSVDDYKKFWKIYHDQVEKDETLKVGSDAIDLIFEHANTDWFYDKNGRLNTNKVKKVLRYIRDDNWSKLPSNKKNVRSNISSKKSATGRRSSRKPASSTKPRKGRGSKIQNIRDIRKNSKDF